VSEGAVRLVTGQRAGKGPMAVADFLRGTPVAKGTRLG
jgi:methionyl-tRNA formyltransferase